MARCDCHRAHAGTDIKGCGRQPTRILYNQGHVATICHNSSDFYIKNECFFDADAWCTKALVSVREEGEID